MQGGAMAAEMDPNDPRSLWQSQEEEKVTVTIDEIRSLAKRFERRIFWRNFREYAVGVPLIVLFGAGVRSQQGWQRLPPLLLIAGIVYSMFQLHRRGAARSHPADTGLTALRDFHMRDLEQQRDALHTVWKWYLLPFVPGLVAVIVVRAMSRGVNARLIATGVFFVVTLIGIWLLNEWAAGKLDRRIDALKRMELKDE
jgi:hypothetical protein